MNHNGHKEHKETPLLFFVDFVLCVVRSLVVR
jgi:hypothetical protein